MEEEKEKEEENPTTKLLQIRREGNKQECERWKEKR